MKKRIISFVLALMVVFGLLPQLAMPAEAATSKDVMTRVSQNLPIVTYASPLSGASRVYSYSSSALSKKTTGYYIDTFKDKIVITQIANNGKAVYVAYPSTSAKSGYRSRWFATDDILGLSSVSIATGIKASQKTTSYRMSNAWNVTSWGSVFKDDICTQLGKHYVNGKSYNVTIFPITSQRINGVSGVKHKMALANVPAQNGNTSSSTTSLSYALYKTSGGKITCGFDGYVNTKGRHEGIDFLRKYGAAVYSLTDGVVTSVTRGYDGGSGLSTIAVYYAAADKTIVYLHAAPLSTIKNGMSIRKGQQIATEAYRGVSSKSGTHTHVEVRSGYKTAAAKSVGHYTLDNANPTSFWNSLGYSVK